MQESSLWIGRVSYLKESGSPTTGLVLLKITAEFYADGSVQFRRDHSLRYFGYSSSQPPEFSDEPAKYSPTADELAFARRLLRSATSGVQAENDDSPPGKQVQMQEFRITPMLVQFPPQARPTTRGR